MSQDVITTESLLPVREMTVVGSRVMDKDLTHNYAWLKASTTKPQRRYWLGLTARQRMAVFKWAATDPDSDKPGDALVLAVQRAQQVLPKLGRQQGPMAQTGD